MFILNDTHMLKCVFMLYLFAKSESYFNICMLIVIVYLGVVCLLK